MHNAQSGATDDFRVISQRSSNLSRSAFASTDFGWTKKRHRTTCLLYAETTNNWFGRIPFYTNRELLGSLAGPHLSWFGQIMNDVFSDFDIFRCGDEY